MSRVPLRGAGAILLLWITHSAIAADGPRPPEACQEPDASVVEPQSEPLGSRQRLRRADELLQKGCNVAAARVLEAGLGVDDAGSAELQRRLRETRSLLEEDRYIDGLRDAEEAARRQRLLLRCTRLADLDACADAVRMAPRDPAAHLATADALLGLQRPGDAIVALRAAQQIEPTAAGIEQRLQQANSERQRLATTCQTQTLPATIGDCDRALLPGAPDEFTLRARRALLLQFANQPGPALDAYIAAAHLNGEDRAVATAIVTLTDASRRGDVAALVARGEALLTLRRPQDAETALRQARTMDRRFPRLDSLLARAVRQSSALEKVEQPAAPRIEPAPQSRRYSNVEPANRSH